MARTKQSARKKTGGRPPRKSESRPTENTEPEVEPGVEPVATPFELQVQLAAAKILVDTAIEENSVALFSNGGSHCLTLAKLLEAEFPEVTSKVYNVDERDDKEAIYAYLKEKTGQPSMSSIFINKKYIGGRRVITSLKPAKLAKILADSS